MTKILIILADGFEEIEAVTLIDLLRRADIDVTVSGLASKQITGSHQITILCDEIFEKIQPDSYDFLVLPGGLPGTANLKNNSAVIDLIKKFKKQNKDIAAICAAPTVLYAAGILDGKKVTSHPTEKYIFIKSIYMERNIVEDEGVITSRGVGTAIEFSLYLIEKLKGTSIRDEIASKILYS